MRTRIIALAAVIALAGSVLSATGFTGVASQPASATADARLFDAGNIISDAMFFDGQAMDAGQVQSVLNSKVATCLAGYTCLKSYSQATPTKAAVSGRCNAYTGAASESAAAIIAKVGAACGISQKALVVLLEKEQSLVTDSSPSADQFRKATGYACPDTSACDAQYFGFFNQVYNAALQFKRYAATPTSWNHVAGRVNAIRFSPTATCGSSNVFIQNQATAGLYNYTPYQPDPPALANLYGSGGACSSYGNRNFWRIFTDWFGSPNGGTSLLRTLDNGTVFVVSGTSKYPVASLTMLNALSVLGQVGYVSQSYLNGFSTQQTAGRVLRDPNGTIYFFDAGIKLPFSSCALVVDYGGTCGASGFMQLTAEQIGRFANGPAMGPMLGTTAGSRYYVTQGTTREVLDDQSQTAAGLPGGYNVLTEDAVSGLAVGQPIIRDGAFASIRGASGSYYLGNAAKYSVSSSVASTTGAGVRVSGSLNPSSLARIPSASTAFTGVVQIAGSSAKSVLNTTGRLDWQAASSASLQGVVVPQSLLDSYPSQGTIVGGSMVKTASSGTVYIVQDTRLLPVGAWESLVALAGGGTPDIKIVPDPVVAAIPAGPVALTSNTLARSPDNATVFLVNGVTNKIAMSNFAFATEAGMSTFSFTTQDRLDAYPVASTLLGFGLTCGTTNYVAAGGAVHKVDSTLQSLYPFTFVNLDTYTCQLLKVGVAATKFIRTPSGSLFYLQGGQKHPLTSMAAYASLGGGGWLDVVDLFANQIPTGAPTS
jgi:hypothetical protein